MTWLSLSDIGMGKDVVGQWADAPARVSLKRSSGDRVSLMDQNTSPPISTLGYATTLS